MGLFLYDQMGLVPASLSGTCKSLLILSGYQSILKIIDACITGWLVNCVWGREVVLLSGLKLALKKETKIENIQVHCML